MTITRFGYSCPDENCTFEHLRRDEVFQHLSRHHDLVLKMCDYDSENVKDQKPKVSKENTSLADTDKKWRDICRRSRQEIINFFKSQNIDNRYDKTILNLEKDYVQDFGPIVPL